MKQLNFFSTNILTMVIVGIILILAESDSVFNFIISKVIAFGLFALSWRMANVWKERGLI